jgi:hypothetical protein
MQKLIVRLVIGFLTAATMPVAASAQLVGSDSPPPASVRRPYRGLFGNPGSPEAPQSLMLSASLYGAYDDNVTAALEGNDSSNDRLQKSGDYYGATAGINYSLSKSTGRFAFGVGSAASVAGYLVDQDRSVSPHANLNGTMRVALGRHRSLTVGQSVVYSRFYRFLLFPGVGGGDDDGVAIGDPDLELFARTALRYGTNVGFNQALGSRSSLSAGYSYGYTDYRDGDVADWRYHRASIGVDRRLTANATLALGYGYQTSEQVNDVAGRDSREVHNINVGVNYSRALSFSRRTSLSFSTGSGVLVRDDLQTPGNDPRARLRLVGNLALTHEIGRTWTAQAAYHRGFVFRDEFADPFLTDGATASIGGFITRRLDLMAMARWSLGTQGRPGNDNHNALSVSVQSRYALNQFLALFARYIYYEYEFGDQVVLDPQLPRALDRQGVRAGLTASFPLFR